MPAKVGVRRRAEKLWAKREAKKNAPRDAAVARLTHELEVHQIELELQNEELQRAKDALDASYNELYDFAPVGYLTFGQNAIIRKANLTAVSMLGCDRSALIGRCFAEFIAPAFRDKFHRFMQALQRRNKRAGAV